MGCGSSSQQYPVHPVGNGSAKPPAQIQQANRPYPNQAPPQHAPPQQQQQPPQQRQPQAPPQQPQQQAPPQQQPPQQAPPQQQQQEAAPQQQSTVQHSPSQPPAEPEQPPVAPQSNLPEPSQPLQDQASVPQSSPQEQDSPENNDNAPSATPDEPQGDRALGPPPPDTSNQLIATISEETTNEGPQQNGDDNLVTEETLKKFIEYEKEITTIEKSKVEEHLAINETQLKNLENALKNGEADLQLLRANTEKEKRDFVNFDIANYMFSEKMLIMGPEEARKKEQEEYIEAQNKQDVAEKQVERLRNQIESTTKELVGLRSLMAKLNDLRTKVDGLLENIFNGEYGSELEDRLELETEQLLQYKQHISVAHYKWHNGRALIHHACSQLAYSKKRWEQIQTVDPQYLQARYQMVAEVRGNLIAAHQNIERTREYLNCNLLYFTVEDSQNLLGSINSSVVDILSYQSYHRALEWYKYYHYRSALLLNWMDQTINNKIIQDHKEATRMFYEKYAELRQERLRCIRQRVKGDFAADFEIGKVDIDDATARIELDLKASESGIAIAMETPPAQKEAENDAENFVPPPVEDNKESAMTLPEPPAQSEAGPPANQAVPLSELAPPPSSEELFGNISELKKAHKTQLAEFEKAQTVNKTRMDQGLEEKLRARKSKRRRANLHEEQMKALSKKYENSLAVEETMTATEETPLGGDGNPDVITSVNNNNNNKPAEVNEDTVVAVEETGLGGDGNPDHVA